MSNALNVFIIDGKNKSFADVIVDNKTTGSSCIVATYGIGVKQVRRLIREFDKVVLIADNSHAKINPKMYDAVLNLRDTIKSFCFVETRNHAKLAIVDNEIMIFTSANLSKNHRLELYLIANTKDVENIDGLMDTLKNPEKILETLEHSNRELFFDDFDFDLILGE